MALPAHLHAYSFLKTWEVITNPWHFKLHLVLIFCKQVSLMSFEKAFHRSWNTMASKYMKRCLTSLVAKKCKFRPHQDTISLIILAKVKRMKASYVAEKDRGVCPPSDTWLEHKITSGRMMWSISQHKKYLRLKLNTLPLEIHPTMACTQRNTCKDVHQFLEVVKRMEAIWNIRAGGLFTLKDISIK